MAAHSRSSSTPRFLGDWFGFAASVLEQVRAEAAANDEPGRVQLWPEHFDMAFELGSQGAGRRAGYGCSPGDEAHDEPYVYVVPWNEPAPDELWQARSFRGAELPFAELSAAPDQRQAALEFLRTRRNALAAKRRRRHVRPACELRLRVARSGNLIG